MNKEINLDQIKEGVCDYIQDLFNKIPDEDKSDIAYFVAIHAAIYGSYNTFEGVGILELVKRDYINTSEQVLKEEENE